jgi:hypothetical protein
MMRAETVRQRLDSGDLPRQRIHLRSALGRGQPCDGCKDVIPDHETAVEATAPGNTLLLFHVPCFMAWETHRILDPDRRTV